MLHIRPIVRRVSWSPEDSDQIPGPICMICIPRCEVEGFYWMQYESSFTERYTVLQTNVDRWNDLHVDEVGKHVSCSWISSILFMYHIVTWSPSLKLFQLPTYMVLFLCTCGVHLLHHYFLKKYDLQQSPFQKWSFLWKCHWMHHAVNAERCCFHEFQTPGWDLHTHTWMSPWSIYFCQSSLSSPSDSLIFAQPFLPFSCWHIINPWQLLFRFDIILLWLTGFPCSCKTINMPQDH